MARQKTHDYQNLQVVACICRIKETPKVCEYLNKAFGLARMTYNLALAEYNGYFKEFKTRIETNTGKKYKEVKDEYKEKHGKAYFKKLKEEYGVIPKLSDINKKYRATELAKTTDKNGNQRGYVTEVTCNALETGLANLQTAFKNFYAGTGKLPTFKKVSHKSFSFDPRHIKFDRKNQRLFIQFDKKRLGKVEVYNKLRFDFLKLTNVTFSRKGSRYYVSIAGYINEPKTETKELSKEEIAKLPQPDENEVLGIDLGCKTSVYCSDGTELNCFDLVKGNAKKLARLQRKAARQYQKGKKRFEQSRGWKETQKKVGNLHAAIQRERKRWREEVTRGIAAKYDVVCVETLKIRNITKRRKRKKNEKTGREQSRRNPISKSFLNVAPYAFVKALKHYCKQVRQIGQYEPSSKTCSVCGHKQDMPLNKREFKCGKCGAVFNRDYNAAINIKKMGLDNPAKVFYNERQCRGSIGESGD
ncbi:MAG: transposase [Planctomycetaceae bacterium]|jgi:putative transposase|nr:transposase [Planctomycetaceae bacterium]